MTILEATDTEPLSESAGETVIRERIEHILKIYPKVSMSMLQVAIGTGLAPALWHPVLNKMLLDNVVSKKMFSCATPTGRSQTYTVISLQSS